MAIFYIFYGLLNDYIEKNVGNFLAALLITSVLISLEIKVSLLPLLVGKIFFGSQCYVTEMFLSVLWVEINNRAMEGRSKVKVKP